METNNVKVANFRIRDVNIRGSAAKVFEEKWGVNKLPLGREKFEFELMGVPSSVPNAIQRTMMDEMKGYRLSVKPGGFNRIESTDPFMSEKFVTNRIIQISLRPRLSDTEIKNFKFELHYDNTTSDSVVIYAGDLTPIDCVITQPIFNPTIELAILQPGKSLHITGIHITEGYGYDHTTFCPVCRGALRPLDIEQFSDEEIRVNREEVNVPPELHISNKVTIADLSGFKKSTLDANPRHHAVSGWLPAVEEKSDVARLIVIDACTSIMNRLRNVQKMLETDDVQKATQLVVTSLENNAVQGILSINETHTISNLIKRSVYELWPNIGFIGYTYDSQSDNSKVTIINSQDSSIDDVLIRAIKHTYNIFEVIRTQLKTIKLVFDPKLNLGL